MALTVTSCGFPPQGIESPAFKNSYDQSYQQRGPLYVIPEVLLRIQRANSFYLSDYHEGHLSYTQRYLSLNHLQVSHEGWLGCRLLHAGEGAHVSDVKIFVNAENTEMWEGDKIVLCSSYKSDTNKWKCNLTSDCSDAVFDHHAC